MTWPRKPVPGYHPDLCTCTPEMREKGSARANCPVHGIVASSPGPRCRGTLVNVTEDEASEVKGLGLLPHEWGQTEHTFHEDAQAVMRRDLAMPPTHGGYPDA